MFIVRPGCEGDAVVPAPLRPYPDKGEGGMRYEGYDAPVNVVDGDV